MTDKKFADDEIIKALNLCKVSHPKCEQCPYFTNLKCVNDNVEDVVDLINRQKAENEKLNIELKAMRGAANSYKAEVERLKKENKILSRNADTAFQDGLNESRELFAPEIKAEAYKEFAKQIKEEIENAYNNNSGVLREHLEKHKENSDFKFVAAMQGRMNTLSGLDDFIDNLLKEKIEQIKEEHLKL